MKQVRLGQGTRTNAKKKHVLNEKNWSEKGVLDDETGTNEKENNIFADSTGARRAFLMMKLARMRN